MHEIGERSGLVNSPRLFLLYFALVSLGTWVLLILGFAPKTAFGLVNLAHAVASYYTLHVAQSQLATPLSVKTSVWDRMVADPSARPRRMLLRLIPVMLFYVTLQLAEWATTAMLLHLPFLLLCLLPKHTHHIRYFTGR